MKWVIRLLLLCMIASTLAQAQNQSRPYSKIYLGNPFVDLRTTLDPTKLLDIADDKRRSGYALIETDLDSLGLLFDNGKTYFLKLEAGKSYYYWNQDGGTEIYLKMLSGSPFQRP